MTITSQITNEKVRNHLFLKDMYAFSFYPKDLVDKITIILQDLCIEIEKTKPDTIDALYTLTHAATEKLNILEDEFFEKTGSGFETIEREALSEEFYFIAQSYGFMDADYEELVAPRNW